MFFKQLKKALRRPARDIFINGLAASILINKTIRRILYRLYGMKIGNAWIAPGCEFVSSRLEVGDGTWIQRNCVFDNNAAIKIGANCDIAFNVIFITNTHVIGNENRRAGKGTPRPITVEDGCWIGANSTIMPGVTIGAGCIIGAGSVVNKDCLPHGLYAGNPAKRIKDLQTSEI